MDLADFKNKLAEAMEECNHDFRYSKQVLGDQWSDLLQELLELNGGFCDCEILMNVLNMAEREQERKWEERL